MGKREMKREEKKIKRKMTRENKTLKEERVGNRFIIAFEMYLLQMHVY